MSAIRALLLALALVAAQGAAPRPTVFLIGDSTMADRPDPARNPERGWGQMLPLFLDGGVAVHNAAANGRSTKSFLDEGRWEAVRARLAPGDYVLIQFGHNDQKVADSARYTSPYTGYRRNLERFVAETRAAGATPVLLSPIVRRRFNGHGVLEDTHGAYPVVARDVAREHGVAFVDLQLMSGDLVRAAGPEGSKALFLWLAPGESPMHPEGARDDTHLSVAGATAIARLAALGLRRSGLPLGRHVVGVD